MCVCVCARVRVRVCVCACVFTNSEEEVERKGEKYISIYCFSVIVFTGISCSYEHSDCGHLNISNSNLYAWRRVRGEEMMSKPWAPKTDFTYGKPYGKIVHGIPIFNSDKSTLLFVVTLSSVNG